MSVSKILVDTNILGYVLDGEESAVDFLDEKDVYISSINQLEILTWRGYKQAEMKLIQELLNNLTITHTNNIIISHAVKFRKSYNFKLPDAVIAATARFHNILLFTAGRELFKIKEIQIIEFYPEKS